MLLVQQIQLPILKCFLQSHFLQELLNHLNFYLFFNPLLQYQFRFLLRFLLHFLLHFRHHYLYHLIIFVPTIFKFLKKPKYSKALDLQLEKVIYFQQNLFIFDFIIDLIIIEMYWYFILRLKKSLKHYQSKIMVFTKTHQIIKILITIITIIMVNYLFIVKMQLKNFKYLYLINYFLKSDCLVYLHSN